MENFPKDVLYSIALELNLPDLINFCKSHDRIDDLVCKKDSIWITKLNQDFPDWKSFNLDKNYQEIYTFLYDLRIVQNFLEEKLRLPKKYSLLKLYNLEELYLSYNQLKEIPDLNLPNLQRLYLDNNQLTEMPNLNLANLKILNLNNNQLTKISNLNLPELVILYLNNNQLKEISNLNLPKLSRFHLYNNNQLRKISNLNVPELRELEMNNKLVEIPEKLKNQKGLYIIQ